MFFLEFSIVEIFLSSIISVFVFEYLMMSDVKSKILINVFNKSIDYFVEIKVKLQYYFHKLFPKHKKIKFPVILWNGYNISKIYKQPFTTNDIKEYIEEHFKDMDSENSVLFISEQKIQIVNLLNETCMEYTFSDEQDYETDDDNFSEHESENKNESDYGNNEPCSDTDNENDADTENANETETETENDADSETENETNNENRYKKMQLQLSEKTSDIRFIKEIDLLFGEIQ
jgi:hypothetical protein